jgi:CarboxypepD_reg-like domain
MSGKKVKLNIESPCATNWQGMTPQGNGRYCDYCAKQVVDFTSFTDEQLVRFFHNRSGDVCGRLNNHQLNRVLEERKISTGYGMVARIAAGLLVAAPIAGYAQTPDQGTPPTAPFHKTEQQPDSLHRTKTSNVDSTKVVIEGKIRLADDNSPAMGAIAIMEGLNRGAVTDENGTFRFTVPDSLLTDSLELKFQFFGYESIILPIDRGELLKKRALVLDVVLKVDESIQLVTVGFIVADKDYERRLKKAKRREKRMERKAKDNL